MVKPESGGGFEFTMVASIAATFVGTVVGAGFASGREVWQFFSIHGWMGFAGIGLTIVIMGLAVGEIFKIGSIIKTESYQEFLAYIIGFKWACAADLFMGVFFLLLIGVMFAGCGAIFSAVGVGYWVGVTATALILIAVLFKDLSGLIMVNAVVIPLMFAAAVMIAVYSFKTRFAPLLVLSSGGGWWLAAVQFSAYNLILALPVLLSLANRFNCRKTLSLGGWLGSLCLGLMAGFINLAISSHLRVLREVPLPMLTLAEKIGMVPYWGYAIVLWGEMFTTLLADIYGLSKRLGAISSLPYSGWVVLLTGGGICIAEIGFNNLIAWFYPIYGYLSLILLMLIVGRAVKR